MTIPINCINPTTFRKLEITLVSANNLLGRLLPPSFHPGRPMKVYAEVSLITGDSGTTPKPTRYVEIDNDRSDATWNLNLEVEHMILPHPTPNQTSSQLIVKLYRKRSVVPDTYIGRVEICVNTLHQKWLQSTQNVESFDVKEIPNGKLNISYSFKL